MVNEFKAVKDKNPQVTISSPKDFEALKLQLYSLESRGDTFVINNTKKKAKFSNIKKIFGGGKK